MFLNGMIVYGVQVVVEVDQIFSIFYYYQDGVFVDVFYVVYKVKFEMQVGVIGLGCGGMVCYCWFVDKWIFYEIDLVVVEFVKDERFFIYFGKCVISESVVIDDGWKVIEKLDDGLMDVFVVDVFMLDVIFIYLLIKEVIVIYMLKFKDDGVLVMYVFNWYFEL